MKSAYLVIAHGSREKKANEEFFEFLGKFKSLFPKKQVMGAFLEMAKPGIPEAVDACAKRGADQIFLLPLMLFQGRHVKEDIPKMIADAKMRHPKLDFHYASPLSDHPMLLNILKDKARHAKKMKGRAKR